MKEYRGFNLPTLVLDLAIAVIQNKNQLYPATNNDKLESNDISSIDFAMAISEQSIAIALGISAIGLFAGSLYQAVSQIIDRRRYPPQGKLFDIGGFRLHLNCMGQGTPTVLMDAGGGASSITWGLVPSEIAKFTRVCVYDRAGLGWSDPNLRIPRTMRYYSAIFRIVPHSV